MTYGTGAAHLTVIETRTGIEPSRSAVRQPGQANSRSPWNDDVIDTLRALVSEGQHSGSDIASILNERYQPLNKFTRNSVIGKCDRENFTLKAKAPGGAAREPRKAREARPLTRGVRVERRGNPSDSILALPGPVRTGIAISTGHRSTLILAARDYEAYHQKIAERNLALETLLLEADDRGCAPDPAAVEAIGPTPSRPESTQRYWSGSEPKSLHDLRNNQCSFITARTEDGQSHYCGDDAAGGMCAWHKRLCYMPRKPS